MTGTNHYEVLNTTLVNPAEHPDAYRILRLSAEVVDHLFDGIRADANNAVTYASPTLMASFDVMTFGDLSEIYEKHMEATARPLQGKMIGVPTPMTAGRALDVFMFEADKMRVLLNMLVINLRQFHDHGWSGTQLRAKNDTVNRVRGLIWHGLRMNPEI